MGMVKSRRIRWWKLAAVGASSLIVLLCLGVVLVIVHFSEKLSAVRDEEYLSRIHYLWEDVSWSGVKAQQATEDPAWLAYFGDMRNPLMAEGPSIVAYPIEQIDGEAYPAILIFPGGGYGFRSEQLEGIKIARWLNEKRIAAFVINYRLGQYPEPVVDAMSAVSYVRYHSEDFGIDPERVGVLGFSAGGHLAAVLSNVNRDDPLINSLPLPYGHTSSRPDFTVLAYPVITFREPYVHHGSRENLIGERPSDAIIDRLSAELNVSSQTPPTFIWAPKTDKAVAYQNSEIYADALQRHGVDHVLHIFPEGSHGSDLAESEPYASQWPEMMLGWLRTAL